MPGKSHTDTLGGYTLTTNSFPDFYNRIQKLRFPIAVAEVLELRDLINHSADLYEETPDAPANRDFQESLENAIQSFGIENRHHCDRLLRVLSMLRGMHYQHTIASRDAEQQLRQQQAENRKTRLQHRRAGTLALVITATCGAGWLLVTEPGWMLKFLALGAAVTAFGYFHSLPRLDQQMERYTLALNELLRKRVDALNWRTLIHKLSLLLGYKQIQGIEVFRHEQPDTSSESRLLH
jgi:hypothetical protein